MLLELDVCPHVIAFSHQFRGAIDKPKPAWFWGPKQETVAVFLMPKSLNRSYWFWGPNRETLHHLGFDTKLRNPLPVLRPNQEKPSTLVLRQTRENYRHRFWGQTRENRPGSFGAKPLTNNQHWFWDSTKKPVLLISTCKVHTAHGITWPPDHPATKYPICVTIPSPLQQVSYSCHDPRHYPPCRTCHLHTTRQANMILQMKQR
jgi:hypothetical protein